MKLGQFDSIPRPQRPSFLIYSISALFSPLPSFLFHRIHCAACDSYDRCSRVAPVARGGDERRTNDVSLFAFRVAAVADDEVRGRTWELTCKVALTLYIGYRARVHVYFYTVDILGFSKLSI